MLFGFFIKIISAPFLFVYFKTKVYGKRRAGKIKNRTIIIANHLSPWDAVLLSFVFFTKRLRFITIFELFQFNLFFKRFFTRMGSVPVNNRISDLDTIARSIALLNQEKILMIFPEGTRSRDGSMLPFKHGTVMIALHTETPIVPVYVNGKYGLFRRAKVVVGEKIYLHEICDERHPPPEKIKELTALLYQRIVELGAEG